jgi:hypothetical protein
MIWTLSNQDDGCDYNMGWWLAEITFVRRAATFNFIGVVLLAKLYGPMGDFPDCLRLRLAGQ